MSLQGKVKWFNQNKGFAGLIGLIRQKKFTKKDNILFIHTGGNKTRKLEFLMPDAIKNKAHLL